MKIKKYKGDYDQSEFYSIMGMYFAEKQYQKELPYMQNNDHKEWWLFYQEDILCSFLSLEKKKDRIDIGSVYVLQEYRNQGLCKKLLNEVIGEFPEEIFQTISNNKFYIQSALNIGFKRISQRGSYKILERRNDND